MDQFHRKEHHALRVTGQRWSWRKRRGSERRAGHRRFFFLASAALILGTGCEFQRQVHREIPGSAREVSREIETMLQSSAASWNGGDLDGFLDDYLRSESLTFSGATGITRGWDDVQTRYLATYWAPGTVRDSLRFEGIEVLPLGEEHALALGRYVLFRPEEDGAVVSRGFFSLVLGISNGDWKILHDHTSATPPTDGTAGEGS